MLLIKQRQRALLHKLDNGQGVHPSIREVFHPPLLNQELSGITRVTENLNLPTSRKKFTKKEL